MPILKFELSQNLWERFGFLDNPFDTRALSLAATNPLSVAEAFVGRGIESTESKLMTNFLRNPGGGASVLGTGVSFSRGKLLTVQLGEMRPEMLMDYLRRILERVLNEGFVGVIFHLNNLELLARRDSQKLGLFFDEVRDYLQEPNLYFIFVGHKGMFQEVIVPLERVCSIFYGQPIHLPPLSLEDVKDAVERRYDLLAIHAKRWIRPVDQSIIDYLYDIFSGRIRFIMDSIATLVSNLPEGVTGTISEKAAREFLKELTWQRVKSLLTDAELFVLTAAVKQQRFTNSSLVKSTKKSKQNIAKYLNRLLGLNFIYQAERRGRNVYYEISPELTFLDI